MKNQNYNPNPAAMVIMTFSVRDLLSGRNLPPAEEMNRILTHTPAGPLMVMKTTDAMDSPCDICSLQAYHRSHHTCPLFTSCAAHLRAADKASVIFCRETVKEDNLQSEELQKDTQNVEPQSEEIHPKHRISERKKLYLRKLIQRRRGRHRRHRRC